jgi:hypothetical protein
MVVILGLLSALPFTTAFGQAVQDGPSSPSALSMTLLKSAASLPAQSWISSTSLDLHFQVATSTEALIPQVEIEPSNVPFTGQPNFSGVSLKTSGTASVVVTGLVNRQTYHWQARAADAAGAASQCDAGTTRVSRRFAGARVMRFPGSGATPSWLLRAVISTRPDPPLQTRRYALAT